METEISEAYELLSAVCRSEEHRWVTGYRQMRELLERLCRTQMEDESLQMTDLAARVSFLATKSGLSVQEQNRVHTFRLTSNEILNRRAVPTREKLLRDAKTLAFLCRKLSGEEIPETLLRLLPRADAVFHAAPPACRTVPRMRVGFSHADERFLYVHSFEEPSETLLRVRYNVPQVNDEFAATCASLWPHAPLNLLDTGIDEEGILTPAFIVLEPDYLLDISSLAECFKEYGHHPANYLLGRMQPIGNTRALLLGNIANLFLDEWIHAGEEGADYLTCMKKAFRTYPIELTTCTELRDKEKEMEFFNDCRKHFDNIRRVIGEIFPARGYELDRSDAVLEPSYFCEALGLQGRLDYMQRDLSAFIEMKSGKADEYALRGKIEPRENHKVQMLLYQAVLQYSMGMDHHRVRAYLLYTRYPLLYPARSSWAMVKRAIDLRNRIVAAEYGIQLRNDIAYTAKQLDAIDASLVNERRLAGRFWETYLRPPVDAFADKLSAKTPLERNYFHALYNFITKELYISKAGGTALEGHAGASALWLSTLAEKEESGEIIHNLRIRENRAADARKPHLVLTRTAESESLPNFRTGDAIVLYERNDDTDNAARKLVFKGNLESLDEREVRVRLRASQQNAAVLPPESLYAIEHDAMDTTFRSMYQGLHAFLTIGGRRRDLLLGSRQPESLVVETSATEDDFVRIARKAQAARDFFLLVGPPGTGKTSRALKTMVETFLSEPDTQILLLSYTNRAVDEICKALSSIRSAIDFIRIGSELTCEEVYRPHLIENVLDTCNSRSEVSERIGRCRVFVGTVASVSGKTELFRLKRFDVAIVDEASQILEPQLLGILCASTETGEEAVGKFILIGDHKQLPAVVLQSDAQSVVTDELLRSAGIINLKESLFERLYRQVRKNGNDDAFDMLRRQGRMHPAVASFPNRAFYQDKLLIVGLSHQLETDESVCRLAFYPSLPEAASGTPKINRCEARIVARLAARLHAEQPDAFDPHRTLGIIAPYRSQIALIRKEMEKTGIEALRHTLIDTVERFQGSERDVIIYSFCVNRPYQLAQLSNLTEEDGVWIDRKLNVALTRARKRMLLTGVPGLLSRNPLYARLIEACETFPPSIFMPDDD